MNLGRWSALLLLPVVLLLERFSYYGMRSLLWRDLSSSGELSPELIGRHVSFVTWMVLLTVPLGGLVAIALKPRWTVVAGLAISVVGYALLAALGSQSLLAFGVLAVGTGLFRPAIFAAAALVVLDPRESARGAAFVALYVALNVGSLAGTLTSGALPTTEALDAFQVFTLGAALLSTLALLLAAAAAIAPYVGELGEPPDPPFTGRGELGALAVLVLAIPALVAMTLAGTLQFEPFFRSGEYSRWIFYVNPGAVLAIGVLLLGALGAAAYAGKRIPALYVAAGGMLVIALGCAPLLALAAGDEAAKAGAYASIALVACGEVLFYPLALSRMAAGPHPRTIALVLSLWLLFAGLLNQLVGFGAAELSETFGAGATGGLVAAAALATLLAAAGTIALQWFGGPKLWPALPDPAA